MTKIQTTTIDISKYKYLLIIPITGLITAPIIPLGGDPDMYLARESHFTNGNIPGLSEALAESFKSFGFEASIDVTLKEPKVLVVPITDGSELAIKNALVVSDMALAFFNKKYFSSRAQFLSWDRRAGKAIGALYSEGKWQPILHEPKLGGPAIISPTEYDFWDWMLAASLRGKLNELGEALYKCIEWERQSDFSSHITHRFAFIWIGMESMMPVGECQEQALIRRYSLIVGAPRGADSKLIMVQPSLKSFFDQTQSKKANLWISTIKEMYKYRCAILHDGSSDLNSQDINPEKVEWFYHVAKALCSRVQNLAVDALIGKVDTVEKFWQDYVMHYLYSSKNIWVSNGTFPMDELIEFDWQNNRYLEVI